MTRFALLALLAAAVPASHIAQSSSPFSSSSSAYPPGFWVSGRFSLERYWDNRNDRSLGDGQIRFGYEFPSGDSGTMFGVQADYTYMYYFRQDTDLVSQIMPWANVRGKFDPLTATAQLSEQSTGAFDLRTSSLGLTYDWPDAFAIGAGFSHFDTYNKSENLAALHAR